MAAIVWTDVTAIAVELTAVPVDAQTLFLSYVNTSLNVDYFGGESHINTKLARIYLAAHLGKTQLQGGDSIAGPVTSESAGGLSRSYALVSAVSGSGAVSGSSWADRYMELVNSSLARLPMVI